MKSLTHQRKWQLSRLESVCALVAFQVNVFSSQSRNKSGTPIPHWTINTWSWNVTPVMLLLCKQLIAQLTIQCEADDAAQYWLCVCEYSVYLFTRVQMSLMWQFLWDKCYLLIKIHFLFSFLHFSTWCPFIKTWLFHPMFALDLIVW